MKTNSEQYVYDCLSHLRKNDVNLMQGTRVQMIINRTIGNTNKGSKRWVSKLISYDEQSYINNVSKLMNQLTYLNQPGLRLYASINERYPFKAARNLTVDIIDHLNDAMFLSNIHNELVSHLMKPECKTTKYILIDCDSLDQDIHDFVRNKAKGKIITDYPTPNGYHFICKGFDTREMLEINKNAVKNILEIKKDALLLICPGVEND